MTTGMTPTPPPRRRTKLDVHKEKWAGGCGSKHCENARRVYCRGDLPCDILFIGEAPGESENALLKPFIGPAGKLLDDIIGRALGGYGIHEGEEVPPLRLAFTNVVCCIPRDENGDKWTEPDSEQIKSCRPRLVEFVRLAKPRIIILLGKTARKAVSGQSMFDPVDWTDGYPIIFQDVEHPAYLIRQNLAVRGLLEQRVILRLQDAVDRYVEARQGPTPEPPEERPDPYREPPVRSGPPEAMTEPDGIPF